MKFLLQFAAAVEGFNQLLTPKCAVMLRGLDVWII